VAAVVAVLTTRSAWPDGDAATRPQTTASNAGMMAAGIGAAIVVAFLFYSSFLRYPAGLLESLGAFGIYLDRGVAPGPHTQPFDYYLRLLSYSSSGGLVWSEGLVIALAVVGLIVAGRAANGFWPRYAGLYTLITFVAFSAIRYKTPWNLLPFYTGAVVMAGYGTSALLARVESRLARVLVAAVLVLAAGHLAVQDWRLNFRYPADPRNPYVYAQTVPDFLRLSKRVADVAAVHPDRSDLLVKVIAGPYEQWPIPWYLRRMPRVGYWVSATEAGRFDDAAIVIAAQDQADAVAAALGDRYVQEFYGLRPDVILAVFIERASWDRLVASRSNQR
jgi:predicted membrane-bound mannosyltransferase